MPERNSRNQKNTEADLGTIGKIMSKIIIFDLGNVLCNSDSPMAENEVFEKTGVNLLAIKDKKFTKGKISPEEYFKNSIKLSKVKISARKLMTAYKQAYLKAAILKPDMIKLVKILHKHYKVVLLSNINDTHWQINKKRGIPNLFDTCFTSCELGITKDDVRTFNIITKKLNAKPEDCIFIDDKEGHVARAKSIGIDAIQFKSYEQLVKELKVRKII